MFESAKRAKAREDAFRTLELRISTGHGRWDRCPILDNPKKFLAPHLVIIDELEAELGAALAKMAKMAKLERRVEFQKSRTLIAHEQVKELYEQVDELEAEVERRVPLDSEFTITVGDQMHSVTIQTAVRDALLTKLTADGIDVGAKGDGDIVMGEMTLSMVPTSPHADRIAELEADLAKSRMDCINAKLEFDEAHGAHQSAERSLSFNLEERLRLETLLEQHGISPGPEIRIGDSKDQS
jgi:hypothetical protein